MKKNIELTPEQQKLSDEYKERYFKIAIDTTPADRQIAESALKKAYIYLNKKKKAQGLDIPDLSENPNIIWVDSPYAGARTVVKMLNPNLTDENSEEFKDMLRKQASNASYGSFEAYWISFYDFVSTEIEKDNDEVVPVLRDLAKHTGVYWTFSENIIVSEKPIKISLNSDKKLHDEDDLALKFKDGTGLYMVNGERKASLLETTIDSIYARFEESVEGLLYEPPAD
jgi:hypothetical protein